MTRENHNSRRLRRNPDVCVTSMMSRDLDVTFCVTQRNYVQSREEWFCKFIPEPHVTNSHLINNVISFKFIILAKPVSDKRIYQKSKELSRHESWK